MKNISITGLAIAALTLTTGSAFAQTKLPADVAACVNQCLSGTPCTVQVSCEENAGRIGKLEQQLADLNKLLHPKKAWVNPLAAKVKQLQDDLAALSARQDADAAKVRELADSLAAHTAMLEKLTSEIEDLTKQIDDLKAVIEALKAKDAEHDAKLANHEGRIEKLEKAEPGKVVSFGARIGFIGVHSGSGTDYTGMLDVVNLTFKISPRLSIVTEAGVGIGGTDSSAIATYVRGAGQYHFNEKWALDIGASSLWAGYNTKLKAAYANVMADVGPTFQTGIFSVHAAGLLGPAFEPNRHSLAGGGLLILGGQF